MAHWIKKADQSRGSEIEKLTFVELNPWRLCRLLFDGYSIRHCRVVKKIKLEFNCLIICSKCTKVSSCCLQLGQLATMANLRFTLAVLLKKIYQNLHNHFLLTIFLA